MDDDRIVSLEQQVKEAKAACEDAENKFEEVTYFFILLFIYLSVRSTS